MATKSDSPEGKPGGAASPTVPATEFKAKCAERMDAVHETRQPLVITKYGRPFVQVAPCEDLPADPVGFMNGTVVHAGNLISADHAGWAESETDPLLGAP
jgi:prevent-host-death family protein